jgi:Domain of unknown function (DUF4062)
MNPKYQIFISSTYEDLKEEREQVLKTVLRLGHIPIGMEMFNAANQTQWEMIKRRIEESDYYIVIIAHRYGSIEKESGLSYTEKEYDYAESIGVPTFGFVINRSASWPGNRRDEDPQQNAALKKFVEKVESKMRSSWSNKDELASNVSLSLNENITAFPRIGWIRANQAISTETINEITRLSKENAELRERLSQLQENQQNVLPIPQLNVELKILEGNYQWYEYIPVKKSTESLYSNSYYLNDGLKPVVELQSRHGKYLCLILNNSGTSATDLNVIIDSDSPILNSKDIDTFGLKDKGRFNNPKVDGWHCFEQTDCQFWSFSGSIYSLKPGQSYTLLLPLDDELNTDILESDNLVNVNIFPVTGKHIKMSFVQRDLLSI